MAGQALVWLPIELRFRISGGIGMQIGEDELQFPLRLWDSNWGLRRRGSRTWNCTKTQSQHCDWMQAVSSWPSCLLNSTVLRHSGRIWVSLPGVQWDVSGSTIMSAIVSYHPFKSGARPLPEILTLFSLLPDLQLILRLCSFFNIAGEILQCLMGAMQNPLPLLLIIFKGSLYIFWAWYRY